MNNISEVIAYIESKMNKKSLEEYASILSKHGIKLKAKKIVHVTGTNGKGSTIHYLANFLMKKGYKVGTFTSPYLISYHDRFCINNTPISDQDLYDIVMRYYDIIEDEKLSKFEIDVLIMMIYFSENDLDYALIEVGIGGLEDKTNVIDKDLAIITNIQRDHMPRLGNTLLDICKHKAGIIKENINVVIGIEEDDLVNYVAYICDKLHSNLYQVSIEDLNYGDLPLYQHKNISIAYKALEVLGEMIDVKDIDDVLMHTGWKGRFERFNINNHHIIIDGAHNLDGIEALMKSLNGDYLVIFSALRDKDYEHMVARLEEKYEVYVSVFEDERKMTEEDLKQFKHSYSNFNDALEASMKQDKDIVITGSLHFISYVRKVLSMYKRD